MKRIIYLDNAATTQMDPKVLECMTPYFVEYYGNPAAIYSLAGESGKAVAKARTQVADLIGAKREEIYFTGGGSESDNWALKAVADLYEKEGCHIITTKIEHASVYNPLVFLEEQGFRITFVSVDSNGLVCIDELLDAIDDETILVSIMYVNNEIGTIEQIAQIGKAIKEKKKDILFHVDAIQAYGKLKIYPKKLSIDLLSVSGHKIHGPKGIGFLYIKDKTKTNPYIYGGGQQKGMRSGTENVPGIAGLGKAVELIYQNHEEKIEKLYQLKEYFVSQVQQIENVSVNGIEGISIRDTAPHVVSVTVNGVRSEVLLHALEEKGVYVSSGYACSSNHPALSGTLQAIGLDKEKVEATVRFSFSVYTTMEELDLAIKALQELVPILRKYIRK